MAGPGPGCHQRHSMLQPVSCPVMQIACLSKFAPLPRAPGGGGMCLGGRHLLFVSSTGPDQGSCYTTAHTASEPESTPEVHVPVLVPFALRTSTRAISPEVHVPALLQFALRTSTSTQLCQVQPCSDLHAYHSVRTTTPSYKNVDPESLKSSVTLTKVRTCKSGCHPLPS